MAVRGRWSMTKQPWSKLPPMPPMTLLAVSLMIIVERDWVSRQSITCKIYIYMCKKKLHVQCGILRELTSEIDSD